MAPPLSHIVLRYWRALPHLLMVHRLLPWLAVPVFCCSALLTYDSLSSSHAHHQHEATYGVDNLAEALALSLDNTVGQIRLSLLATVDELQLHPDALRRNPRDVNAALQRIVLRVREIDAIRVTDATGRLVLGSDLDAGIDVSQADRPGFRYHREHDSDRLVVSPPQVSRVNGKQNITLSLRLQGSHGEFAGMVYAAVTLDVLGERFHHMKIGAQGSISLRDSDMRFLARYPDTGGIVGERLYVQEFAQMLVQGDGRATYVTDSTVDGVRRRFAVRQVGEVPLFVVVGRSVDEDLAVWWREVYRQLALLLLFNTMVVFGLIKIQRMLASQEQLTTEVQDLNARLAEHVAELDHSNAELMQYRRELEDKVVCRTRELTATNARLEEEKGKQDALIAELSLAHGQLLQTEKMAAIGQLAAGIAHEINNPVGFIKTNMASLDRYVNDIFSLLALLEDEAMKPGPADRGRIDALKQEIDYAFLYEDVQLLIRETREGVERVRQIVSDMRTFSHVDGGEWMRVDLMPGVESTIHIAWNAIKRKAEIVREYVPLPEVECMPGLINQVVLNLLLNAVQAIEGMGKITVRNGVAGDAVWLEIEDTGSGIEPQHVSRIFEPFFTTKPVGQGTGLGLSLSYHIIQRHAGRIDVNSVLGQGTCFRIWLPIRRASGHGDRDPLPLDALTPVRSVVTPVARSADES